MHYEKKGQEEGDLSSPKGGEFDELPDETEKLKKMIRKLQREAKKEKDYKLQNFIDEQRSFNRKQESFNREQEFFNSGIRNKMNEYQKEMRDFCQEEDANWESQMKSNHLVNQKFTEISTRGEEANERMKDTIIDYFEDMNRINKEQLDLLGSNLSHVEERMEEMNARVAIIGRNQADQFHI